MAGPTQQPEIRISHTTEYREGYANSVQNNLDSVNYRSKEQEWRAVAKEMLALAEGQLRKDEWAESFGTDPDTYPPHQVWRA